MNLKIVAGSANCALAEEIAKKVGLEHVACGAFSGQRDAYRVIRVAPLFAQTMERLHSPGRHG